jgi:hypothetical protein
MSIDDAVVIVIVVAHCGAQAWLIWSMTDGLRQLRNSRKELCELEEKLHKLRSKQ